MPFVGDIVESINESINGSMSSKIFQPRSFLGLTSVGIKVISKDKIEVMPAMVSLQGEVTYVDLNDLNYLIVYHKILSNTHGKGKSHYGDGYELMDTTEMAMIVFGWSDKLKLSADQLEALLRIYMPERLDSVARELGLNKCLVTTTGTDQDKLRVFRQEFPQSAFFIRPENILFQIKYRIETWFNKACLNQCCPG